MDTIGIRRLAKCASSAPTVAALYRGAMSRSVYLSQHPLAPTLVNEDGPCMAPMSPSSVCMFGLGFGLEVLEASSPYPEYFEKGMPFRSARMPEIFREYSLAVGAGCSSVRPWYHTMEVIHSLSLAQHGVSTTHILSRWSCCQKPQHSPGAVISNAPPLTSIRENGAFLQDAVTVAVPRALREDGPLEANT